MWPGPKTMTNLQPFTESIKSRWRIFRSWLIIAAVAIIAAAAGATVYFYLTIPAFYSFQRLETEAQKAMQQRRYDRAISFYDLMERRFGSDPVRGAFARFNQAQALLESGRAEAAIASFNALEERYGVRDLPAAQAALGRAAAQTALGLTDKALNIYEEVAKRWPGSDWALTALNAAAQLASKSGDFQRSERLLHMLYDMQKGSMEEAARISYELANALLAQNNAKLALARFQEILKLHPSWKAKALLGSIRALAFMGSMDQAIETKKELDAVGAENSLLYEADIALARGYLAAGDSQSAISLYKSVMDRAGQGQWWLAAGLELVSALSTGGDSDGALKLLTQLESGTHDDLEKRISLLIEKAEVLGSAGRYDEAVGAAEDALKEANEAHQVLQLADFLSNLSIRLDSPDQAVAALKSFSASHAASPSLNSAGQLGAGRILLRFGKTGSAFEILLAAAETATSDSEVEQALFDAANAREGASNAVNVLSRLDALSSRYAKLPSVEKAVWLIKSAVWMSEGDEGHALQVLRLVADGSVPSLAAAALSDLAQIAQNKGDIKSEKRLLMELSARFAEVLESETARAEALARAGRDVEALAILRNVAQEGGAAARGKAFVAMMRLYAQSRKIPEVEQLYSELERDKPHDPLTLQQAKGILGLLYQQTGRPVKAIPLLKEAVVSAKNQDKPNLLFGLAKAYETIGDFKSARDSYQNIANISLAGSQQLMQALIGLGFLSERLGQLDESFNAFSRVEREFTDPMDKMQAKAGLARVSASRGDAKKTLDYLKEIATLSGNKGSMVKDTATSCAQSLQHLGQPAQAAVLLADTAAIIGTQKATSDLYSEAAGILASSVSPAKAQEFLAARAAAGDATQRFWANFALAQMYIIQGKSDSAKEIFLSLAKDGSAPLSARARAIYMLASLYWNSGQSDLAEQQVKSLTEIADSDPDSAFYYRMALGKQSQSAGDTNGAIDAYRMAARSSDPDRRREGMNSLAKALAEAGRYEEARQVLSSLGTAGYAFSSGWQEASFLREAGRLPEALEAYRDLISVAGDVGDRLDAQTAVAEVAKDLGRADEALAVMEKAVDEVKTIPALKDKATLSYARLLSETGKGRLAIKLLQSVASSETAKYQAAMMMARIKLGQGELADADALVKRAMQFQEIGMQEKIQAELFLLQIMFTQGNTENAIQGVRTLAESSVPGVRVTAMEVLAEMYLSNREFAAATVAFDSLEKAFPTDRNAVLAAISGKARTLAAANRIDEAIVIYRDMSRRFLDRPQGREALIEIGNLLASEGRLTDAEQAYLEVARKIPQDTDRVIRSLISAADLMKASPRKSEAIATYQKALSNQPAGKYSLEVMLGQATAYLEANDPSSAQKIYEQIAISFKSNANALTEAAIGQADIVAATGDVQAAMKAYKQLESSNISDNDKAKVKYKIAELLLKTGERDEALQMFTDLSNERELSVDIQIKAGLESARLLIAGGKKDVALSQIRNLALTSKEGPNFVKAVRLLASTAASDGDLNGMNSAIEMLDQFGAVPEAAKAEVASTSADALVNTGRLEEAISVLDRTMANLPSSPVSTSLVVHKARILIKAGRMAEAERSLNAELQKVRDPGQAAEARLALADLAAMHGKVQQSLEMYQKIALDAPKSVSTLKAMMASAEAYGKLKNMEKMEETYRDILSDFAGDPPVEVQVHMALGNLFLQQQRNKEAVKEFERVYMRYPNDPETPYAITGAADAYRYIGEERKAEALCRMLLEKYPTAQESVIRAKAILEELYRRF